MLSTIVPLIFLILLIPTPGGYLLFAGVSTHILSCLPHSQSPDRGVTVHHYLCDLPILVLSMLLKFVDCLYSFCGIFSLFYVLVSFEIMVTSRIFKLPLTSS